MQIRLGLHFVPSLAGAAQAARSLTSALSPGAVHLLPSTVPASVSVRTSRVRAACVCSWELASSCDPPGGCRPSRISGSLWLENGGLLQFGRGCHLCGRVCPFPLPPASCLRWGWAGPPPASSSLVLLSPFVLQTAGRLIFSLSLAIPQFKFLSHVSSLPLPSGHSGPVLTLSNAARSSPFCPHLLVADAGIWGTFLLGVAFRHVICEFYLFFLPVRLPSETQKLPPDLPVRGFPGVWKLPLLWLPSRDRSPSLALLSLFLSFIFCPTSFRRWWSAFLGSWCPLLAVRGCFVKFTQRSNVLSMNLQGRKWSPGPNPPSSWLLR